MQYKTIVLELIQDRPKLQEQLRQSRSLLATVDQYAMALKTCHDAWIERLASQTPMADRSQLVGQAMELATQELIESLPTESSESDEPLSLDAAMSFLQRHTPPV